MVLSAGSLLAEQTYRLPSGSVDLRVLARQVAQITGRVVVYGADFTGQAELEPHGPMTRAQVWNYFLALLAEHGWGVSESGGVARIVKRSALATEPGPVFSPPEGTPLPAEQMVTYTAVLQHASAVRIAEQLAPLVSPEGRIVPVPASNSIIIVDTQANVNRLRALVARLDVADENDTIRVVRLRYADAQNTAEILRKIFADLAVDGTVVRRRGGEVGRLMIVAEPDSNTLILRGEPRDVTGASAVARKIDALPDPRVFILRLQNADAGEMATAVGELMR